ncbi:QRFP-like peptide receptor [Physella acuta]|uniref:QRFP-like peptide receptor n=1 Tax=Physella acuta TaxID=109671 RepID=UPI0027DB8FC6|nr:QRFP-like peptide receptor [Physella acuta]
MHSTMDGDTENIIPTKLVVVIFILIIIACFLGNLAVILVVIFRPVLHTSTSFFLLSLSIADLLVGIVVVSLTLVHKLNMDYAQNVSDLACVVLPFIELACVTASVYSLLFVSIDRYRAIVLARKPAQNTSIALSFVLVWVWAFVYSAKIFVQDFFNSSIDEEQPIEHSIENTTDIISVVTNETTAEVLPVINTTVSQVDLPERAYCSILVEEDDDDLPYRILDLVILFVIPVAAMIYIFVQIRKRLWGSSVGATTNVRRKRAVIRFLAIDIIVFVVCWLPFYLIDIVTDTMKIIVDQSETDALEQGSVYVIVRFMCIVLAMCNSFFNPLIYAFFNKNFINEVCIMFSSCRCFTCLPNKVAPETTDETQASCPGDGPVVSTT